jgi:xanthine dehydrogenase accessory factor
MAIREDGQMSGSVSAGCLEGAVVSRALEWMRDGEGDGQGAATGVSADIPGVAAVEAAILEFKASDEQAWEAGLICGGTMTVLLRAWDESVDQAMAELAQSDTPFTYMVVIDEGSPLFGAQAVVAGDAGRVAASWLDALFIDEAMGAFAGRDAGVRAGVFTVLGCRVFMCAYEPRPTIVVVGAVHIGEALVSMAKVAGYHTVVMDPRRAFSSQERFAGADEVLGAWPQEAFAQIDVDSATAVCVLSHDEKIDVPALLQGLDSRAFYIGCIGSFKTLRQRIAALRDVGVGVDGLARIYGPIGLYIGGNEPAEIALSILAQINAVRHGRIAHGAEMPGHTLDQALECHPALDAGSSQAAAANGNDGGRT